MMKTVNSFFASHLIGLADCMWQYKWNTTSSGNFSVLVAWVPCHLQANRVGLFLLLLPSLPTLCLPIDTKELFCGMRLHLL